MRGYKMNLTIYHGLIAVQLAAALMVFLFLFFISAPYGRYYRKGWGLVIPARFAWMIMEFPAFAVILLFFLVEIRSFRPVPFLFLLIWETHYIYRTFIYPQVFRGAKKEFPVLLVVFALVFNTINGTINGAWLFQLSRPYTISWLIDPRFIVGTVLFFTGFFIHTWADRTLRLLRKPGETGYKIPDSGLFRYIASPNYFGEILEWTGWAVLTWSLPGLAFAVFTFANLMPRAYTNYLWYRKEFPDYPKERKILIPFLF